MQFVLAMVIHYGARAPRTAGELVCHLNSKLTGPRAQDGIRSEVVNERLAALAFHASRIAVDTPIEEALRQLEKIDPGTSSVDSFGVAPNRISRLRTWERGLVATNLIATTTAVLLFPLAGFAAAAATVAHLLTNRTYRKLEGELDEHRAAQANILAAVAGRIQCVGAPLED